jgi:manganese/iron transport system permease protein
VTPADTLQLVVIAVVSLAILLAKWKDLLVVFFDESHARSVGLNPPLLKGLFFTAAQRLHRLPPCRRSARCSVIAMVVTPGATAYLLTDRFPRLIAISVAIGAVSSFVGAYLSFFLDGATGGVIVLLQTRPASCAAFLLAPKHGLLAPRWRAAAPMPDRMMDLLAAPFTFPVHAAGIRHRGADPRCPTALLSCFWS